jgi:hypothetical protein
MEARNPLAAAVHGGLTPDEPDAEEIARREKLKSALLGIIDLIDRGLFASAIVTTILPDKWPPQYATQMFGEVDIVKMSAAQIVEFYVNKGKKEAQQKPEVYMPPEPELILPGV